MRLDKASFLCYSIDTKGKGLTTMTKEEKRAWENKLQDLIHQKRQYEKRIMILAKVIKQIEEDLQK